MWKAPYDIFHNVLSTIGTFHIVEFTMQTFMNAERIAENYPQSWKIILVPKCAK